MKPNFAGAIALMLIPVVSYAQSSAPYCSLPGELVAMDAKGDASVGPVPTPIPGLDVLDVNVAELPNSDGIEKVYFTMNVDRQAQAATPATSYQVKFILADGVQRFALYKPYPAPSSQLEPATGKGSSLMFSYGHNEVNPATGTGTFTVDGPADAESSASAGGSITIVLSDKEISQLKTGEIISEITGLSQINLVRATLNDDTSATPGVYQIKGNASCKGKSAEIKTAAVSDKSGTNFGGAFAPGLLFAFTGLAALRRRRLH